MNYFTSIFQGFPQTSLRLTHFRKLLRIHWGSSKITQDQDKVFTFSSVHTYDEIKSLITFPKMIRGIVYIRKYKNFPFSNDYVKKFSNINYRFILFHHQGTLTLICNSYHHTKVNVILKSTETIADSSWICKSLNKCERSIRKTFFSELSLAAFVYTP